MYISHPSSLAVEALWSQSCIAAQVRKVNRVVVGVYDEALRCRGLTVAQLDLLMSLLTTAADVRPVDLARDLNMDRSTLSRNLKRLEVRGLVELVSGRNGRESQVRVTDAGREAAEQAAEAWFEAQQSIRRRLGDQGEAALGLLTGILTNDEEE